MSSDPNQKPTVYRNSDPFSPASQPFTSAETAFSQGTIPPPPPGLRKTSRRWLWISLVILVVVIVGAVTTTVLLITSPNRAVNAVVQDYYNAVKQQDYATAYTYTSAGQLATLSQTTYTQNEQRLDQTSGTLTDYTIVNTSIRNGIATVTVIVNRTSKGEVFVELKQINGSWKIDTIVSGWSVPS